MKTRLAFFAALAVLLAVAVVPVSAAKPLKIIKGPYLQQLTPESIVIMWETNTKTGSRVDYWTETQSGSVEDSTQVKIHEVTLMGLAADTYYYTVTSGGVTSAQSTFWTAPDGPCDFCFVAYGDTRTHASDHAAVIQGIINSGPELVLHTGDLVENGDEYSQWGRQFFDPAYALMINTPLLPVIGNHEGSGNLFRDFFSLGDNDDWFAFSYSNVRFIGLNTHNRSYSPGSTQYTWLEGELQSSECTSADWQIVYFHHPAYSSGSHGGESGVQNNLVPLFEQYGVDMVFNGHDHHYERSFKDGVYYIVTGGGGAPLRDINVSSNPYQQYAESTHHHCVIDVDVAGESLTLYACYNNGDVFDTITLPPMDLTPPTASLIEPLDNGPDDLDPDDGEVTVNTTQPVFDIQLSDVGDGIKDDTVTSGTVAITKDEGEGQVPLTEGIHYTFGYDAGLDVITLAPAGIDPFGDGLYAVTLSGIADMAGNEMEATTLTILIDTSIVPPVTLSFQQGVDGYSGTVDTMLQEDGPYINNAGAVSLNVDSDEPFGTDRDVQALVRFDDIFGSDSGQVPADAQNISALLELQVTNPGNSFHLHRMLQTWSDADSWNTLGNGIQADGEEAAATADASTGAVGTGTLSIDVTVSLATWLADPSTNDGWAMLMPPTSPDGVDFDSSEGTSPPKLIVTFLTTGNLPPTVSITSPSDGAAFTEGDSITIDAVALDSDGTVTKVEFYQDGSKLGEATTSPYSYTWDNVLVGSYSLTAKATDNEGATRTSDAVNITVADTTPPAAPTGLTATAISATQIDIDWADNGEADWSHYNVYRSTTSPGSYTQIASNVTPSSYSDTGLTPSTTYYYVVTAVDASSNESANSNEASATTSELSVPGQATDPAPSDGQTGVNRNTVILSWTAGSGATSHDVYLGTSPTLTADDFICNQAGTTYDPPKLGRQTTYYWRIDEVNAAGTTTGVVWSFTTK